ncbi:MAG TPA: hypothetical protein VGC69_13065 [Bordetella sp.]
MPSFLLPTLRTLTLTVAISGSLLTTGCAQLSNLSSPGYYDPPAESSSTDAAFQGQGGASRNMVVRPPSQIQFSLPNPSNPRKPAQDTPTAVADSGAPPVAVGSPVPDENTAAPPVPAAGANARMKDPAAASPAPATDHPAQRAFLPQAETFVGTFPCLSPSAQCEAQRVTLTLGPNGRWRSRAASLAGQAQAAAPQAEQGCWNVTGDQPAHVLLLDVQGNAHAELLASANNVLSVKAILGRAPTLSYTLTRQPDLDPIDELSKQPLPACE